MTPKYYHAKDIHAAFAEIQAQVDRECGYNALAAIRDAAICRSLMKAADAHIFQVDCPRPDRKKQIMAAFRCVNNVNPDVYLGPPERP